MKLYIYDHCPYCVRARMIFGLFRLPVEIIALSYDDEATPIALIGAKQAPILTTEEGVHMAESLDIMRYIDEKYGKNTLHSELSPAVEAWIERANPLAYRLIMPRVVHLGLPEFATQSAVDYFVAKKEAQLGALSELLAQTDDFLEKIHADLRDLDALLVGEHYFNGKSLSMEDICVFPILRNLSMVRGVKFPPKIRQYVQNMHQNSGINLYFGKEK